MVQQRQVSAGSLANKNGRNTLTSNGIQGDQAAAASLQLLLREDPLLTEHGLTLSGSNTDDKAAFAYAAALLIEQQQHQLEEDVAPAAAQQRADSALQDVERKLALVESLAVRLSRTSPEAVAGHLLRLHGHQVVSESTTVSETKEDEQQVGGTTLTAIRDRADRLERQAQVLDNVARRVESTLSRGLTRMESSCTRLDRVLQLSNTLKMMMRLQFEHNKLESYDLDDVRDLNRAAASISIIEALLNKPEFKTVPRIAVVEALKPSAIKVAAAVRQSAALLLQRQCQSNAALPHLAATLEVYYHLGELSQAVWKAVDLAHAQAERVCRDLWNPVSIAGMIEQARSGAKDSRSITAKIKKIRMTAADNWANGMYEAATQVRNLNSVLTRKTDPVNRQLLVDVVKHDAIPQVYQIHNVASHKHEFSLFSLYWCRVAASLGQILDNILSQDNGKYKEDIAEMYPSIRASASDLVRSVHQEPTLLSLDSWSTPATSILGGSSILNDPFLDWTTGDAHTISTTHPEADNWTQAPSQSSRVSSNILNSNVSQRKLFTRSANTMAASVFSSNEWNIITGDKNNPRGLHPLEQAFIDACTERLCSPLQYMFPENVAVDDDGTPVPSGLSLLPSKYDVQRFDENIRQELSLADPRDGGDATIVTMIANCIVSMVGRFCVQAKNSLSGTTYQYMVHDGFEMSEGLQHDRKVAMIMFTLSKYLDSAPEKTFLDSYGSTITPVLQEEIIKMCREALSTALNDIHQMVKATILIPLGRSINFKIGQSLNKMHINVYDSDSGDGSAAFVQDTLTFVYDDVQNKLLSKFPPSYSIQVATVISSHSVYTFNSNASLISPMTESTRLSLTQDLVDLELLLDQLISKCQSSTTLAEVSSGKPYAELRAMRQMLYWTDLEDKNKSGQNLAKVLLKESWLKDIRPSVLLGYLFSFGPSLLPSIHNYMGMNVRDYLQKMVQLDGSISISENDVLINAMSCCNIYQQRATSSSSQVDGDTRIPDVVLYLGQELMK